MSVLERSDHLFSRRFGQDEKLPTPWDNPIDVRPSDVIIVNDKVRVHPAESSAYHEAVEGLGWVMLPRIALEAAGVEGLLAASGFYQVEAA